MRGSWLASRQNLRHHVHTAKAIDLEQLDIAEPIARAQLQLSEWSLQRLGDDRDLHGGTCTIARESNRYRSCAVRVQRLPDDARLKRLTFQRPCRRLLGLGRITG